MKRFSLRWLLLTTVLGAITVAFTGFAIYLDRVERSNRLDDIDTELIRAQRSATRDRARPGAGLQQDAAVVENPVASPVQLRLSADGSVLTTFGTVNPFDEDFLAELAGEMGNLTTLEPRYRVLATRTPQGETAITAFTLDEFDAAVRRFRTALIVGAAIVLALVAAVLWALTGFLTRPVAHMGDVANRIAAGDLDTPIGPPTGPRETADLAVDLDRMVSRLRGLISDANQSRDATERMLADMAHEIRTPLTALKGYSDLYAQGMLESTSDVDRAMSRIGSESERLNALANAMLQLASEGIGPQETDVFDVAQLVDEVSADLRAAYGAQRIEVGMDGGPHSVRGSRDRLQQAIVNLGSNACNHNRSGLPIAITVHRHADSVRISVADRGPGIDHADQERIFLPFYRSDSGRSREGQHGAGLGLALTKQIAEQHNGTVSVEPTAGGGATFVLTIPRARLGR